MKTVQAPNNVAALAEEESRLQRLRIAEPERQAHALKARAAALDRLARATILKETGQGGEDEEEARADLARAEEEILVNGRRGRALEEMYAQARQKLAAARLAEEAAARARWRPKVEAGQRAREAAFVQAAIDCCAGISLLNSVPPGLIDEATVLHRLSFTAGLPGEISFAQRVHERAERMKEEK